MIKNKDIFNINKVSIPFSKTELEKIINKTVTNGYISISYENLIETLKEISNAQEYQVTLNPNTIFMHSNSPLDKSDVLIRVEGMQTYKEFIDNVIHDEDDISWSNFLSYSELFKDEIKSLKTRAYRKFLWNYHNIDTWFTEKNIGLLTNDKNMLLSDFSLFYERVLKTDDFKSFIDCCLTDDIQRAVAYIVKGGCSILMKYKTELNSHIVMDNMQQEVIILKKPIITKIFMLSSAASKCRKDWPKIKFTVLDKKSFDTIGLWEK